MDKRRKETLDALWMDTEVYQWLMLLAEKKENEALKYEKVFQESFEEKYKGTSLSCLRGIFWEGRNIAEKLSAELTDWGEYIEYMETFNRNMNEVMYETDIFDSYIAKNVP